MLSRPESRSASRPRLPALFSISVLGLALLAGCIAGPDSSAADREESTQAPRSKTGTEALKLPSCTRIWSEALADSTWDCPDPKPPAPGRPD